MQWEPPPPGSVTGESSSGNAWWYHQASRIYVKSWKSPYESWWEDEEGNYRKCRWRLIQLDPTKPDDEVVVVWEAWTWEYLD